MAKRWPATGYLVRSHLLITINQFLDNLRIRALCAYQGV